MSMSPLFQYNDRVLRLFSNFLKNKITLKVMIEGLKDVEDYHKEWVQEPRKTRAIWFRFYTDDTLATTIDEIYTDLKNPEGKNYSSMIENLKIACKDTELEIYYS